MTDITSLFAPFRKVAVNFDPQPSSKPDSFKDKFVRVIHWTGVEDFDFSYEISSSNYGTIDIHTIGKPGEPRFYAAFITKEEVNKVIKALRAARDHAFSDDPATAP